MTLNTQGQEYMTPRQREEFEQEKVFAEMQSEHNLKLKELEMEIAKIESKWSSWLKIPITLIKLPVLILFGIAYIVSVSRKQEPSESFWKFISK